MGIMTETTLNLVQAAKLIPPLHGQKQCVHPATLTRWIREGRKDSYGKRVHLEAVTISGTFITSREAVQRFLEAIAIPAGRGSATSPTQPTISPRVVAAMDRAKELGV